MGNFKVCLGKKVFKKCLFKKRKMLQRNCDVKTNEFVFNPLPDMPILGSSNSAAIKDIMSKIQTNPRGYNYLIE